tara:strand:+ start:822 stop:2162 length:1341 start_codon:yes stop_codon:yes gene_type:complete
MGSLLCKLSFEEFCEKAPEHDIIPTDIAPQTTNQNAILDLNKTQQELLESTLIQTNSKVDQSKACELQNKKWVNSKCVSNQEACTTEQKVWDSSSDRCITHKEQSCSSPNVWENGKCMTKQNDAPKTPSELPESTPIPTNGTVDQAKACELQNKKWVHSKCVSNQEACTMEQKFWDSSSERCITHEEKSCLFSSDNIWENDKCMTKKRGCENAGQEWYTDLYDGSTSCLTREAICNLPENQGKTWDEALRKCIPQSEECHNRGNMWYWDNYSCVSLDQKAQCESSEHMTWAKIPYSSTDDFQCVHARVICESGGVNKWVDSEGRCILRKTFCNQKNNMVWLDDMGTCVSKDTIPLPTVSVPKELSDYDKSTCYDDDQYCTGHKRKSYCNIVSIAEKCKRTCGVCDPVDPQQPIFRGCLDQYDNIWNLSKNQCQNAGKRWVANNGYE